MQIISISGLDGSGKSTQINLLKNHLESQGKKVFYFHAIAFSFPQKSKEFRKKYCLICKITNACKVKNVSQEKSVTSATWLQIQLRKLALSIDLFRFKIFTKKLTLEGYDYLLSDRYFYDNVINIAYLSNCEVKCQMSNVKHIPRPDHAFYLKTDPQAIMTRDRVPDQGMEYLEKKKELLDEAAEKWNLKIIDGNRSKEEIFEEIKNAVIDNQ